MSKIERRFFAELRAESEGDEGALVGYASKFGVKSHDLGGFVEQVTPGAFQRSIRENQDIPCLFNHDPNVILGRTKNGTLKLNEDATGLYFRCVLPPTQQARDLHALVKKGYIDGCSFAFIPRDQSWEDERNENGDLYASRKLMDVDLRDISVVLNPAYPNTEVSARQLFPDGEPVEVRAAVDKIKTVKSLATDAGEKAKIKDEHRDASKLHRAQGFYHGGMASDHDGEARSLMQSNDVKGAAKHAMAAASHRMAHRAHDDAGYSHDMAHESTNDVSSASARMNSGMANECTRCADGMSESAPAFRAAPPLAERRATKTKDAEKRGEQAIELNPISLPQPFDSDLKKAWWDSFTTHYQTALHDKKLRNQDAISYAIAAANKDNVPASETPAEVAGQGKNPTEVPHEVIDTDGESNGDDDQAPKKPAVNPNRNIDQEAEERVYKTPESVPDYVPADKKAQWKEVWNSSYKSALKDGKSKDEAESSAFAQANGVAGPKSKKRSDNCDASDGNCDDPNCDCQNNDVDDADAFDFEDTRAGKKVKTKKVGSKNLTHDKFAYVGDVNDTTTWKLPIHDKAHADNAAARENQTQGIPSDKKDAVHAKIVAAQKKFGESKNSFDATLANAVARLRLIQLDIEES